MDAPPIQYVTTSDGISVAYSIAGRGLCVVYMGLPINHIRLAWQHEHDLLSNLAERFRLVQYDSRGQGLSSRNIASSTVDDHLSDLTTVVNRVSRDPIVLVAGGFDVCLAVKLALAAPERVAALVLRDTTVDGKHAFSHNLRQLAAHDWETFLKVAQGSISPWTDPRLQATDLGTWVSQDDWLKRVDAFDSYDLKEMLPQIVCPTLIVATTGGTVDWVPEAKRVEALVPNAKLVIAPREELRPRLAAVIASFLEEAGLATTKESNTESPALSTREMEVIRLVASGRSNQQIADDLVISLNTVRRHLSNIFAKTGATNRVEAVAFAYRHKLIDVA